MIVLRDKDDESNKENSNAQVELRGTPEEIDLAYKEIQFLVTYNRFMIEQETTIQILINILYYYENTTSLKKYFIFFCII